MNQQIDWQIFTFQKLQEFKDSAGWYAFSTIALPVFKQCISWLSLRISKNIVSPMRDEKRKEIYNKYLRFLLELYIAFLPMVIFEGIAEVWMYLSNSISKYNELEATTFFILTIMVLVVCKVKVSAFMQWNYFIILILSEIYGLYIIINLGISSILLVYYFFSVLLTFTYFVVKYGKKIANKYKLKSVKCIKSIRIMMSYCFIIFLCFLMYFSKISYLTLISSLYFGCWFFLCIIEWFIIEKKEISTYVRYKIVLSKEVLYTTKKISQLNQDKLEIILSDGSKRIVANKDLKYIEYNLHNFRPKKKRQKIICIQEDGNIAEYHWFKYYKENWVIFHKYCRDTCNITIKNDFSIKEIRG